MRITLKEQNEKLSRPRLNGKNVEYYCSSTKTEIANYNSIAQESPVHTHELRDVLMNNLKS